jgi:hypothetical protein
MIEAQGANGRFQVRDRDGAMTEIGRVVDPPICTPFSATALTFSETALHRPRIERVDLPLMTAD